MNQATETTLSEEIFAGGGEMGGLMRSLDWSKTPLGSLEGWSQSLRTSISILLNTRHPMFLFWGSELVQFYNDGYRPSLGVHKHPQALGQRAQECWNEIWHIIGPQIHSVMLRAQETWHENQLVPFDRNGYFEEIYFTYSYSPVRDETGGVGGTLVVCTETTQQVLGERRLRTLREVAAHTAEAKTVEEACHTTAKILSQNPSDIPFALVYLVEGDGKARLVSSTRIEVGTPASPELIDLTNEGDTWRLTQVHATKQALLIDDLTAFGTLPAGNWSHSPHSAFVLPIAQSGIYAQLAGFIVMGISAGRAFDDEYRGFFNLVANNIATAIANANAYQEERRRAEALLELDRAKTTFFSNISHEFRTPLTLMLDPLEEVLSTKKLSPSNRDSLNMVHRNALRLQKLVNTLLDFSRIEAGRTQAVYEPTNLAMLTADLAGVFRAAIERAGMRLVVNCPPFAEPIYIDQEMWEKIVLNLLSNAFKFTFEGEISVALHYCNDHVELEIRDTGTGIPESEIPHLFKRFHRVKGALGRTNEGSGIGLSLVEELVKLHGGAIRVISVVGQGSSFIVSIPTGYAHLPSTALRTSNAHVTSIARTPTAIRAAGYIEEALRGFVNNNIYDSAVSDQKLDVAPVGHSSSLPDKILIADDNADICEYVKRLLISQGYEVEVVGDGIAALASIQNQAPDLVLSDVMMPHLDGLELLQKLRANQSTREIPIILLSARAGEESRIHGLETGADDYLAKPFSAHELLARVKTTLKLVRLRQEATRREQVARELAEQANRIKDEFLAVLSHELRSPLNPILGWTKMLQSGSLNKQKSVEALATIERNAKLQSKLIEDLLDISRIMRGKLTLNPDTINLPSVISAAMETVRIAAEAKLIKLNVVFDPNVELIFGDAARLQQVIWNLLTNAVKFTPNEGRVEIQLSQVHDYAQIQVSDTGIGINSEFLPYVFEYFRQEDSSTTRKFGGLGLGLAIARQIVEMHGGTIAVTSQGDGLGATFTVQLPLLHNQVQETQDLNIISSSDSDENLSLLGVRALIIDDDVDTLEFTAFLLEQSGVIVTPMSSASEALELVESLKPHIILSDIGMPDMNGYMFIQALRSRPIEQGGEIPAIALTAYAGEMNQQQAIAVGFQRHFSKPVDPLEVVTIVAELVGDVRN